MIKKFFINTLANNKKRYKNKLRSDPSAHQKCLLVKTYPSIKVRSPAGWAVFQTSEAFLTRPAGSGLTRGLLPGRPPKGTTTSVCQYKGAVRTLKPKQPVMYRAVIISGQVWVSPDVLNQTASLPVYLQRFPQIFRRCLLHRRRFSQTQELLKVLFPPSTINRVHVSCSPARPENFLSSWTEVLWRPMKVLPKGSQIQPWTPVAPPTVFSTLICRGHQTEAPWIHGDDHIYSRCYCTIICLFLTVVVRPRNGHAWPLLLFLYKNI